MDHDLKRLAEHLGVYIIETFQSDCDPALDSNDITNLHELADTIEECGNTLKRQDFCRRTKKTCRCGDDGPCKKAPRIRACVERLIEDGVNWCQWKGELDSANSQE